jgi:hypothetical protein
MICRGALPDWEDVRRPWSSRFGRSSQVTSGRPFLFV